MIHYRGKRKGNGYLYILKAENGLYKIGVTRYLKKRIGSIITLCPCKVELIYATKMDKPYELEKQLHHYFSAKHSHGEWFSLLNYDVRYIQGLNKDQAPDDEALEVIALTQQTTIKAIPITQMKIVPEQVLKTQIYHHPTKLVELPIKTGNFKSIGKLGLKYKGQETKPFSQEGEADMRFNHRHIVRCTNEARRLLEMNLSEEKLQVRIARLPKWAQRYINKLQRCVGLVQGPIKQLTAPM